MTERPLGVTIIGILWILGGILGLLAGAGFMAMGTLFFGPYSLLFGIVFIIIGIIEIVLGYGCFQAWPRVWTVGVILTVISLLLGIGSLVTTGAGALMSIVISGIILYYLFQPHVKAYFGKA
ncbi:MAG: hypothetical protein GKC07_08380 [Methanomicrobiales archaeon]|nr:hypothetical protein [Methanomicrobiales archaeon]